MSLSIEVGTDWKYTSLEFMPTTVNVFRTSTRLASIMSKIRAKYGWYGLLFLMAVARLHFGGILCL